MNYLAHLLLAGAEDTDRLGALMGDFVKGPLPGALNADLAAGVMLHRRIDSFADAHPAFHRSRCRISAQRRRYGGILVDMFYDHLLARHWQHFHDQDLADFAREAYALLRRHEALLPVRLAGMLPAMEAGDWLASYGDTLALALALERMSRHRLRSPNPLANGEEELQADAPGFEADFLEFLPAAMDFSARLRQGREAA